MPLTLDASNPGKIIFTLTGLMPQYVNRAEFKLFEIDGTTLLDTLEFSFQDGDEKSYIFGYFENVELDHHYTVTAQTFDSQDQSTLHLWKYIWTSYHINKHCVNIGGFNCYDEWGLIPTERPVIAPPPVKSNYVELPGSNESIDYTQLLDGKVHYGQRTGSWTFYFDPEWSKDGIAPNPNRKKVEGKLWSYVYNSLLNKIHGKRMYVVLADDPEHAYLIRLKVNKWSSNGKLSQVTIDYESVPGPVKTRQEGVGPYLTFTGNKEFDLYFVNTYSGPDKKTLDKKTWDGQIYYSTDTKKWAELEDPTQHLLSENKVLYLRGKNNTHISSNILDYSQVIPVTETSLYISSREGGDVIIDCTGNIETLLDFRTVGRGRHPKMDTACFAGLFAMTSLRTAPELLATDLAPYCYYYLFFSNTELLYGPSELPATKLAEHCYDNMFYLCTHLWSAPRMTVNETAPYCCYCMFSNCLNIGASRVSLPASILSEKCYAKMFLACYSLSLLPELPAMTLAPYCYDSMFRSCRFTKAPELPATELAEGCYRQMFYNDVRLNQFPKLRATILPSKCYESMFSRSGGGIWTKRFSEDQTEEFYYEYRIPFEGIITDSQLDSLQYMFYSDVEPTAQINTTYYVKNEPV